MKPSEINITLDLHKSWIKSEEGGLRADLSGADLPEKHHYAQISFDGHGERGRKLTAFKTPEATTYSCGCFAGDEQELRKYIDRGEEKHKESRLYALTCLIGALEISERRKA